MSSPVRYYNEAPLELTNVDQEAGILRNVALMSIGEAAGHSCRVDLATLQGLFKLAQGKSIKAYLNHSYNPAPTEVVGVFSGIYIDNEKGVLRASQFKALDAFKTHNRQAFDTLFELATTAPESFGVSVVIYQNLEDAADGGSAYIRPISIDSADFVSSPAANKALFSKENPVDVIEKPIQEIIPEAPLPVAVEQSLSTPSAANINRTLSMSKALYSAFKDRPEALLKAVAYAAEAPEGTTDEQIVDKVQTEFDEADQAALIAENVALKAEVEILKAKVAELSPEAAKVEEMGKKIADQEGQIAELSKRTRSFGTRPVNVGKPVAEAKQAPTLSRSQFAALDPKAQGEHFAAGGKLTE
jgi:hypothetical protein